MTKKTKTRIKKIVLRAVIVISILFLIFLTGVLAYFLAYKDKIYPNVSVAGLNVSGLSKEGAYTFLSENTKAKEEIDLIYQEQTFKIKLTDIGFSYDLSRTSSEAYLYTRTGSIINDTKNRISLLTQHKDLNYVVNYDPEKLQKIVSIISGQISIDAIPPAISKVHGGVSVSRGVPGKEVNQTKLVGDIILMLSKNSNSPLSVPVDDVGLLLDDEQVGSYVARAEKFLGKSITLKFEYFSSVINDNKIFTLINPLGGYDEEKISEIIKEISSSVERDPQNPKFVFDNGKVTEFKPALDGIKVDNAELAKRITEKLDEITSSTVDSLSLDIPVAKTPPEINTGQVNNLGIKELIGRGTSTYYHSIPGRIHNVALASSRINGTLVKPGETFSFNQALGDVSAFTGYKQAYIISEGKTILGDGGGVCQVSSTLFRAVLNSGLPVVERQAHAYRVGYYEQGSPPGLDATVYSPSPDFKFTNDTPNYILIEATADTKNYSLIFEIYGTSDGRVATISKPVVTGVSQPPPDVYQDDPTLPAGTIRQVDYKAWGAKVTFNYKVTRNGKEIINKTFISNYKPWAAVYLRGTGPAN